MVVTALFIATIKASLVAGFFMHLLSEKKLVYTLLAVTVIFLIALLLLPFLTSLVDQTTSG